MPFPARWGMTDGKGQTIQENQNHQQSAGSSHWESYGAFFIDIGQTATITRRKNQDAATMTNGLPLADEYLDLIVSVPSVEDKLFQKLAEAEADAERARTCALLMVQIRSCLTPKQYRRLWLLCVEGMSVEAIAAMEGVTHQNVSKSIIKARKKLQKNFGNKGKQGAKPPAKT